jgi:hypothetical protein
MKHVTPASRHVATCTSLLAICLASCDVAPNQDSQKTKAFAEQLSAQLNQLENRLSKVEAITANAGNWTLWYQPEQGFNTPYPVAQSAFPTKEACLESAYQYSVTGGAVTSRDPYVIQTKTVRFIYRCLPNGIDPYMRK